MNSASESCRVMGLDRLAGDDELGRVLPSLGQLAMLGQRVHVFDGIADGSQRAAVGGGQRLGELRREIAGRQGHRETQNGASVSPRDDAKQYGTRWCVRPGKRAKGHARGGARLFMLPGSLPRQILDCSWR